jgi:hypothetical protein
MRFFLFLLLAASAVAQSVGDFSINYKANSTGPQSLKTWAKANSTLWGTDASGNPQSITIGSGLSLTSGVLTASGGGVGTGTVTSVALTMPNIFSVTGSPITASGTLAASLSTQSANTVFAGPTTGTAATPTFRVLGTADIPDLSGTYQPLASILTAISALTNAAGVLTNDGSGILSYTGTSEGGNSGADAGKLVKFADGNGTIIASTLVKIYPYGSTSSYLELSPTRINWARGVGNYCSLIPAEAGSAYAFYLPNNPGTHTIALEDGNISGTAGGLSSTLSVSSGGTGQTSWTNGQIPIGNTTGNTLTKATLTAGTGISITNGGGSITIAATASGGTVTSVAASVPSFLSVSGSPITGAGTLAITYSGTALPVANGGTGITAFGTGIAAALGANIGSAGAPVLFNGDAGTPSAIVLTNATGTAAGLSVGVATSATSATYAGGLATTGATVVVSSAAAPSTGQVLTATSSTAATWQTPSGGGKVAQVVYTEDASQKTSAVTIPLDDTIPQNTDGTAYAELDTSITPTNASSYLLIEVTVPVYASAANSYALALFKDSDADAIATCLTYLNTAAASATMIIRVRIAAGSTAAKSFKIRFGRTSGSVTMYLNDYSTPYFGGSFKSSMTVTEILP